MHTYVRFSMHKHIIVCSSVAKTETLETLCTWYIVTGLAQSIPPPGHPHLNLYPASQVTGVNPQLRMVEMKKSDLYMLPEITHLTFT